MRNFISIFLMCAVGIFVFLFFGFGLFYNFWGIIVIAAFLMAIVVTAFAELWRKTEELEDRVRELEKREEREKRFNRTISRRPVNRISGSSRVYRSRRTGRK